MAAYSSQTVAQLKELLKSRSLSTAGVKNELIARLEEADKAQEQKPEDELLEMDEDEPKKEEDNKPEEANVEVPAAATATTTTDASTGEKKEEPASKEAESEDKPKLVKELTPEERKAAALELLNKKLARAKKFGSETDVEDVKKQLDRVEKFGVELGTGLAKELGLASKEGLDTHRKRRFSNRGGRHRGGFRNRRRD